MSPLSALWQGFAASFHADIVESAGIFHNIGTISFETKMAALIAPILVIAMIIIMRRDYVKFNDIEQKRAYVRRTKHSRILIGLSRTVVIILITLALMSPFISMQKEVHVQPKVVIIKDISQSMQNTNQAQMNELISKINQSITTEVYQFGAKSSSWDDLSSYFREKSPVLVISDGDLSGDALKAAGLARSLNSTVNFVAADPIQPDLSVKLDTPKISAAYVDTPIRIIVGGNSLSASMKYNLTVKVNNQTVLDRRGEGHNEYSVTINPSEGQKKITASIDANDYFSQNNKDISVITVQAKPKVLLITKNPNSPLEKVLKALYDVRTETSFPRASSTTLKDNYAVVFDNIPASGLDPSFTRISNYLLDGNGAVFVGGDNSYDYGNYKGSQIEKILPVNVGSAKKGESSRVNVAIVIDISGSTGTTFAQGTTQSIQDVEKNLAISVLRSLKPTDYVSVIAFNRDPYVIAPLAQKSSQTGLEDKILTLNFLGGTWIYSGLNSAIDEVAKAQGSKYVILLSDGFTDTPSNDENSAISMKNGGITLYTVGVGQASNGQFLRKLATLANGNFFQPEEKDKFKILFGTSNQTTNGTPRGSLQLSTWDNYHFISSNLSLSSFITGYNQVIPKDNSRLLVVTSKNNPVVTSGYFGLGRVVSLSTDDGQKWAGNVYEANSELISRIVNYAIGDSAKRQELYVDTSTATAGSNFNVNVYSKSKVPQNITMSAGNYSGQLSLNEIDFGQYQAVANAPYGFYSVLGKDVAVSYSNEYNYYDNYFNQVASATNGKVFEPSNYTAIIDKIKQDSKRVEQTHIALARYLLLLAAIIFLVEVSIRRLAENRRGA